MMMTHEFGLDDPHVSAKGTKSCRLVSPHGKVAVELGDWTVAPFGPSTFDRDSAAPRQNFEMRVTGAAQLRFQAFDEWARSYILQHCERLFDKKLSAEQVADMYCPTLSCRNPDYPPLLRTKISMPNAPKPTPRASGRRRARARRRSPSRTRDSGERPTSVQRSRFLTCGSWGASVAS